MAELPQGTVTFLFTDIEGSTRLLHELGDRYASILMEHRSKLRVVFDRHHGVEVGTEGDSFFVAFSKATDAAAAARDAQAALAGGPVRVRMGIHTGEPQVIQDDYVGIDVHRAARISNAAHGGQVLLSERTRAMMPRVDLKDLGLHRLKDMTAPERLYQLGDGDFPPLRSLNTTNLPIQTEPLIGRQREITDLTVLAAERRVVTLTGPGGTGKTRLALQAAAELIDRFADGVFWVPLAAIGDPALVLPEIGDAIGALGPLADHIGAKKMLLVLDNLEQVLDCAPHISKLLSRCPELHVLATSRAPLRIEGEREYAVEPLPDQDAVALFRERATNAEPEDVVSEICRRVDRLPLAVELAAARTRLFTPQQLLDRLAQRLPLLTGGRRDLPERQRTLRATIEWSHDLLDADGQTLFAKLGAFAGSFDLDAAETVTQATLESLERLIEESLIRRQGDRFSMLETIREYAIERLDAGADAAAVRERHARHFLEVAERGAVALAAGEPVEWIRRAALDDDNLRAAMTWAIGTGSAEVSLRFCTALGQTWEIRSRLDEGARWVERALLVPGETDPRVRARALTEAGRITMFGGTRSDAVRLLEQGVALWRDLDEPIELANALNALGTTIAFDDRDAGQPILEEALQIATRWSDGPTQDRALHLLGELKRDLGDYEAGAAYLKRSIALATELGRRVSLGSSLHSLGDLELDRGDVDRAANLYRESLRNAVDSDLHRHKVYCIAGLAAVAARRDLSDRAAVLWAAVERAERDLSFRLLGPERERYSAVLDRLGDPPGDALDLDDAVELALRH